MLATSGTLRAGCAGCLVSSTAGARQSRSAGSKQEDSKHLRFRKRWLVGSGAFPRLRSTPQTTGLPLPLFFLPARPPSRRHVSTRRGGF
ncbi:uncharacterized protein B0I36DRAFT_136547 [Microdochium trichocladiopsis]|uniref:Uncharacterized protein n=1 Tax=Microdochium trichocladiopsis TaxID=1682393 RepID=A0A9P8Y110_9PEZI|nr:uncharacterized protein B0I36DRAFT_136547 [Microdochium trichocladiopsis]KAH7027227.1 hypothetical protein B0I36DRAFT_136547 [Microdochium trichocladiopsis]